MDEKGGAFDEAAASGFCTGGFEPWQRSRMGLGRYGVSCRGARRFGERFFPACRIQTEPDVADAGRRGSGGFGCRRDWRVDLSGRDAPESGEVFPLEGAFLIIVAAGLLAGSLRALHEAGIWNALQDIVLDPSKYLHEDSPLGVLLGGFFGYTDHPAQGGALVWLLYLIPVMIWFLRGSRPSETLTRKEELK